MVQEVYMVVVQDKRVGNAHNNLEDAPVGFVSEQAHAVKGMYLYCPEDAGIPLPPRLSKEITKYFPSRFPDSGSKRTSSYSGPFKGQLFLNQT